jgi:hypothetical protein
MTLMKSKITFWMTSDALLSTQPLTILAVQATMKITKPMIVTRAFKFGATSLGAAAKTVVSPQQNISMSKIP